MIEIPNLPYPAPYHAIENTANQNPGKLLYIRRYSTEPSHRAPYRLFNATYFLWHGIK